VVTIPPYIKVETQSEPLFQSLFSGFAVLALCEALFIPLEWMRSLFISSLGLSVRFEKAFIRGSVIYG
jgi:hypothetical protein